MQSPESDCPEKRLDRMWSEHRTYLKHLLLGLTRDIHLTDDLLQETYVHARAGIAGYAGGSSRAWLAEIAKRCFFAHRRRRYVRMEEPLEPEEEAGEDRVGSLDHLMLLELRQAISELDLPVRTALIMKHYGDFTYKDIAEHQCCPVGTAKWRVSSALDRLREALAAPRKERIQMECSELGGTVLADYVYRILPARKAKAVRSHLEGCSSCREEAEALGRVATALDAFEHEHKSQVFYEIDEQGISTVHGFASRPNTTDKPMDVVRFADTGSGVRRGKYLHVAVRGEPIELEVEVEEEENIVYAAKLSRPIEPGECQDLLVVYRDGVPNARLVNEKERVWIFRPGLMVKDPGEVDVRVEAVRLPPNAKLLSCDPRPDEVFANDTITVLWRRVLADWETFGLTVVYQTGQA